MFMALTTMITAAALQPVPANEVAPPPMVANDDKAEAGRLHIGNTGIACVKDPCPRRAVFVPDERGQADRNNLLYVDLDGGRPAPPLVGNPEDVAAIVTAWDERRCLAIDGRLIPGENDQPELRVDRIVGPCNE
ncbi:hypothetical protein GRI97_09945 [Altererythrobacter xixiisoli]|uniref:Uncharacterized protein n=1 Tax=Croceibacterium xixiisoli TaxID=1476466 RepID=A0A6I4TVN5_9SPHN|nr:hypothetical protein [Croceibacterium xixiisoli]MXO99310.1 hypothetical protein [Croceibacterium xixiisoli]